MHRWSSFIVNGALQDVCMYVCMYVYRNSQLNKQQTAVVVWIK